MKKLKLQLLLAGAVFAFTCTINAQVLSGSINAANTFGDGDATASSLLLTPTNKVTGVTGDFAGTIPIDSFSTTFYSGTLSGLSTTPLLVSIDNYLVFSTPASSTVSGTSPINRFEFNLTTITEDSYNSATGNATFTGTGTLLDTTGAFSSQQADLTIDFSEARNYTFSIVTVPEPATLSLAAAGLLGALVLRGRKA